MYKHKVHVMLNKLSGYLLVHLEVKDSNQKMIFTGSIKKVNFMIKRLYKYKIFGDLSLKHLLNEPKFKLSNDVQDIILIGDSDSPKHKIQRVLKKIHNIKISLVKMKIGLSNHNELINIIKNINIVINDLHNEDIISAIYHFSKVNSYINIMNFPKTKYNLSGFGIRDEIYDYIFMIISDLTNPNHSLKSNNILLSLFDIKDFLNEFSLAFVGKIY